MGKPAKDPLSFITEYPLEELFNMEGVPKPDRDYWRVRAELAKKVQRQLTEMVVEGKLKTKLGAKKYRSLVKEFVAIYNTDPKVYLKHDKWAKAGQVSPYEAAHHDLPVMRNRRALLKLKTRGGYSLNAAQRDVHKHLEDIGRGLANHPKNVVPLGEIAHVGDKTIEAGKAGSSVLSAHPPGLKAGGPHSFDSPGDLRRAQEIIRKSIGELQASKTAILSDQPRRILTNQAIADVTGSPLRDFYKDLPTPAEIEIINQPKNVKLFKALNKGLPAFELAEKMKHIPRLRGATALLDAGKLIADTHTAIEEPSRGEKLRAAIGASSATTGLLSFIPALSAAGPAAIGLGVVEGVVQWRNYRDAQEGTITDTKVREALQEFPELVGKRSDVIPTITAGPTEFQKRRMARRGSKAGVLANQRKIDRNIMVEATKLRKTKFGNLIGAN